MQSSEYNYEFYVCSTASFPYLTPPASSLFHLFFFLMELSLYRKRPFSLQSSDTYKLLFLGRHLRGEICIFLSKAHLI